MELSDTSRVVLPTGASTGFATPRPRRLGRWLSSLAGAVSAFAEGDDPVDGHAGGSEILLEDALGLGMLD